MKHLFCVVCVMMVLALGSFSFAKGDMSENPACKADAKKFCAGKTFGKGLIKCMHENHDKLSQSCQDAMKAKHEEMKGKMEAGREACAPDIEKFCPDKKGKGPREVITCLKGHEAELSPDCKNHATHGPGMGAMMPSTHSGVMTSPQPASPVGTGTSAAGSAGGGK